jgi:hypothetical protein
LPGVYESFCLVLVDKFMLSMLDSLTFNEDGIFMQFIGFSFIIAFSKSEEELLESLGDDIADYYKDKDR